MPNDDRSPNPDKQPDHDDANVNPGTGASSPGEAGYSNESKVSGDDGEALIDIEEKRAAMEADPVGNDPAQQSDG